jgi:pimeloyl-ACP methyl ester carboxylesterase
MITGELPAGLAVRHDFAEVNGIRMHFAECGAGPLVVLCHGFPESWYSWRHQLLALADAGFRAVAPDMRGYGRTDQPESVDQYTLLHIVGDMVGLLDALGADEAVIAGHDWGAPVAWNAALLRPDRFRAVIGLSVPFRPRSTQRPTGCMPQNERELFYQLYFQDVGVAEAELQRDIRSTLLKLLFTASGEAPEPTLSQGGFVMVPRGGGVLSRIADPKSLPQWLSVTDLDFYEDIFARTGFRGGLNWYRNIDRNWELLAPFSGAAIRVPALYVAGDRDLVLTFPGTRELVANLSKFVPSLRRTVILPGCGHWTQQERSREVNEAMTNFLRELS